jgi:hypothetical protein
LEKNMSDAMQKIDEVLKQKRDQLRKRRAAFRKHAEKLTALFADVEALGGEPYSDGDWIFVPLSGDKVKFLAFVRLICKHGFDKPTVEKGATGFTRLDQIGTGDDLVYVYFQFSSTQCRRVKVGTETVEQDVYETVCDELMPYGDTPPPAAPRSEFDSIPF